ncbi:hypothetical protein ACFSR6_17825 [Pedobacter vanadiisoli]|uniref:Lipoprotein n=1 Tax=Pedobacter vanadiisoli TaxID=1761975 RepID=A0ABW5MRN4_9SPHI
MKFKLVMFLLLISCKSNNNGFKIDRFLNRQGMHSKLVNNKILQTNIYDHKLNLILKNDYSRTGCNLVDSTIYVYSNKNKLLEERHYSAIDVLSNCKSKFILKDQVLFKYNPKAVLVNINVLKGLVLEDSEKNNNIFKDLKDSLSLLKTYISDIKFIANNTANSNLKYENTNNSNVYTFKVNAIPSILLEYGIPTNELLLQAKIYITNNHLIKDEFKFQNYILTRKYDYKNNILQKVTIENTQIENKDKSISIEYFVKTKL